MKTRFEMNIEIEALEALRVKANGAPVAEIIRSLIDAYLEDDNIVFEPVRSSKARSRMHRHFALQALDKMKNGQAGAK